MIASRMLAATIKPRVPFGTMQLIKSHPPATMLVPQAPVLIPQRWKLSSSYNFTDSDGWIGKRIGNREIVGFGVNGEPEYVDRPDFPFPSIRYKPPMPEIQALREKERGDWRLLSIEEKKALYRANFGQTFAEFQAPTGDWMYVVGITLILTSLGIWMFILMKLYVYRKEMPKSFKPSRQVAQLRRILDMHNNPITGLASKWDYENKKWKSKPWYIPWENPYEGIEECAEDQTDDDD